MKKIFDESRAYQAASVHKLPASIMGIERTEAMAWAAAYDSNVTWGKMMADLTSDLKARYSVVSEAMQGAMRATLKNNEDEES